MTSAFEYILKAGGLEREEDYPYTGTDRGSCKFQNGKIAASAANFSVISNDADQIAANLVKNGPLASNLIRLPFILSSSLLICIISFLKPLILKPIVAVTNGGYLSGIKLINYFGYV